MSITVVAPPKLLTAEEFLLQYDLEPVELDKGQVVENAMPTFLHGLVCSNISYYLNDYVRKHSLGRVVTNDTWMRTRRSPDSVRGPDMIYISYQRLPVDIVPIGILEHAPELIIEVRSPSDSWKKMLNKSSEYLNAGATIVVILDPDKAAATIFRGEELPQALHNGDDFTLPDIFPGFSVPLAKLFSS